jgi:D-amino-acid dehydrogenase
MKVVVLGGGLIGLASAHALLKDGHDVVVVDRASLGGGATPGNAGWVCQSQVAPLAAPGMLRHSASLVLKPSSPLYVSPRVNRETLRFLLAFARRCNRRAHRSAVSALVELASTVEEDFDRLEAELGAHRSKDGVLCCFTDAGHARTAHEQWAAVDRVAGTGPGPLLDGPGLQALEPSLSDEVAAGFLLPQDSHVDPAALAAALRSDVEKAGATVVERAGETELIRVGNRITGVRSASDEIRADQVVVAAGAGSARYLRHLGVRVPMVPGTGYSFTVRPSVLPTRPLHLEEAHVACTPLNGALRVAGTMEISGRTSGIDERRVRAIVGAAGRYLRDVQWDAREDVWGAPRPVTSDGLPLIGRPSGVEGCVVATGHGMYGVTLAPTTGRLVAAIVSGQPGPPALSPSRLL